jgi:rod shape-determining protein MreC
MQLRRRLIDWGLAALLLVIPALILRSSLKRPDETNKLDQAVLRVSSPLQAAVTWMVDGVGSVWSRYIALVDVERENRELRDENEKLRAELAAATRRAVDIETLEKMLDLKNETQADTVAARVIAASMSPHFRVLRIRIDRGEHEVAPDMTVITSDGLVGRIVSVYGGQADVMLVTDASSKVPVMIKRSGLTGEIIGESSNERYGARFEWQTGNEPGGSTESPIQEGDIVETSGRGNLFPAGIVVGRVAKVSEQVGIDQQAEIESAVDFSKLRGVTIIVAPPPPPDPDAEKKKKSASAFGVRPF